MLFQVSGMPAGGRLRLAVMDEWNGVVFNVSQNAGEYLQVGRELPWRPEVATQVSEITARAYDDVWVPSFGGTGPHRVRGRTIRQAGARTAFQPQHQTGAHHGPDR